jgi:hypothetical protein
MSSPRQEQTNDYKFFQKSSWQGLEDLRKWNPQADPTIGANFGRQKNDLERSFVAPTGSYQTPELREQQMQSGIENIGQNQAIATRADQYGQNQLRLGQLESAAKLSAPEFANKSSTQQQKGINWGGIIGGGLSVAAAL